MIFTLMYLRGLLLNGQIPKNIWLNWPLPVKNSFYAGEVKAAWAQPFSNLLPSDTPLRTAGSAGEENWFVLELKLLADVGLVGFPNAGKSTLLTAVSAKTKDRGLSLSLLLFLSWVSYPCPITGLCYGRHALYNPGSSWRKGLGLRFLRHIERNSMLLFLIPADSPDITAEYKILLQELRTIQSRTHGQAKMLAVTKADLLDEQAKKLLEDVYRVPCP